MRKVIENSGAIQVQKDDEDLGICDWDKCIKSDASAPLYIFICTCAPIDWKEHYHVECYEAKKEYEENRYG